jgi:peroxiredoxin
VSLILFGVVLPWVVIVLAAMVGLRMLRQHGRILQILETLEEGVEELHAEKMQAEAAAGLLAGVPAPPFELPDLAGRLTTLEEFRGRRVLLIFFSPECAYCQEMADQVAALPWDGSDGRPVPLLVSAGDAGKNQAFMDEHGIRCPVLLQGDEGTVAAAYLAQGTPVGYLIDDKGVLATGVVEGGADLLALADPGYVPPASSSVQGDRLSGVSKGAHVSGDRVGLKAGTPAPDFRLPRLDGGELSLEEYRGRRLLLVFSDPDCEPCDALAPELERLHRAASGLAVVMVGRGEARANRAKVKEHGLTFPVVLQRDWEISRLYRKSGITPSGYLIDEGGVIAADMAVGGDAILGLATGTDVPANGRGGGD